MSTLHRAAAVIRQAEQDLRVLVTEAASSGEYDSLATLADWAKQLTALSAALSPLPAEGDGLLLPAVKPAAMAAVNGPLVPQPRTSPARRRNTRKREYPKFLRRGDDLVKIGWSKSERAPYEHKAPKAVVTLLIHALTRTGQGGRVFTMDELLPLNQPGGGEVPSYQAYLALAWIRAESLITQHGRQGYSLLDKVDLAAEAERRWSGLPTR